MKEGLVEAFIRAFDYFLSVEWSKKHLQGVNSSSNLPLFLLDGIKSNNESEVAAMPDIGAVRNPSRGARLLKAKQALLGFANGSNIAAMADTGSRKNVMSESYAKSMGFTIEDSPSTFEIGNSRKIQSIGRSRCRDPQRSSLS